MIDTRSQRVRQRRGKVKIGTYVKCVGMRLQKSLLITVLVLVVLVIGGLLLIRCFWEDTFFGSSTSIITSGSSTVTLAEARQYLSFALPDEASDIRYLEYRGWQAYQLMVKFRAPADVCKAHAIEILKRDSGNIRAGTASVELREITTPPEPVDVSSYSDVGWFDIHNIGTGFVGGQTGSHQPRIWIDAERGLFYCMSMD